jgi:hypothetical protein
MRCKVCLDERVQDVDAALAAGRSAHSLAVEFGLPPESMKRHARSHARRFDAPVNRPGTDPLVELTTALRTPALGGDTAAAREYRLALHAVAAQSAERPAYNVLIDPEWIALRTAILRALEPYPEARQAVADAIR